MPSGVEEVQVEESTERTRPTHDDGELSKRAISEIKRIKSEDAADEPTAEESVEVVLAERGTSKVVDSSEKKRSSQDQSIFRAPHAVRPRAMRAANGHHHAPPPPPPHYHHPHHPPYPYSHGSGSWGYGPPPPHGEYPPPPPPRPYPVPPYNPSGSFDDQASYHHHHTPHYSPHVQYPPHGARYPGEDVNVISPNHKGDPHYRPPLTPRPRHLPPHHAHYYQYPPTSPVSRSAGQSTGGPRLRNYAMRRGESAYARSQRSSEAHPKEEGRHYGSHPTPSEPRGESGRPPAPVVAESFDSEHPSQKSSHPPTPGAPVPPPPPQSHDPHHQFYGGGSWGSFDSSAPPPPAAFEDPYYQGFPPNSPYSPYAAPYSPGGIFPAESFPPPPPHAYSHHPPHPASFSYSYDDEERLLKDYHPDRDGEEGGLKHVTPTGSMKGKGRSKTGTPISSNKSNRNMVLPKAAEEIDFEVTDPPMEPILPSSDEPVCESLAEVNTYDVLCGRGGGTNSQIGNRRFRKLVQEFQPTYLMAKRKEKPLLARTIVLIIRKRGGRFLKKNEDTGELFEVGDTKAEAKTSQALREGLDVRATKSAATSLVDKKKKKKNPKSPSSDDNDDEELDSPKSATSESPEPTAAPPRPPESPPTLPRLQGEEVKSGTVHPHSPTPNHGRKRRRMRATDRFFPDFCPPRADLGRGASPDPEDHEEDYDDDGVLADVTTTPIRRNQHRDDDQYEKEAQAQGCAGIALDMVTGAASGSFCLGPTMWRRR